MNAVRQAGKVCHNKYCSRSSGGKHKGGGGSGGGGNEAWNLIAMQTTPPVPYVFRRDNRKQTVQLINLFSHRECRLRHVNKPLNCYIILPSLNVYANRLIYDKHRYVIRSQNSQSKDGMYWLTDSVRLSSCPQATSCLVTV
jgi:hypothetical protein